MEQASRHEDPLRENRAVPADDKFARESFTFRRMKNWQIGTMGAVLVIVFGLVLFSWMT